MHLCRRRRVVLPSQMKPGQRPRGLQVNVAYFKWLLLFGHSVSVTDTFTGILQWLMCFTTRLHILLNFAETSAFFINDLLYYIRLSLWMPFNLTPCYLPVLSHSLTFHLFLFLFFFTFPLRSLFAHCLSTSREKYLSFY